MADTGVNLRYEHLKSELELTQKINNFRGSWISTDKDKYMDILSLIQAYTQYDRRRSLRRFQTIQSIFRSRLREDIVSHTWYGDLNTCIDILTFFMPSIVKEVRDYIASTFCGQVEIPCKWGKIDVLNSEYMFIIDEIEKWESTFGRILTCSSCFPSHTPVLVLGTEKNEDKKLLQFIRQICNDYDIKPLRVYKNNDNFEHTFMEGCQRCGSGLICEEDDMSDIESSDEDELKECIESKESKESSESDSDCEDDCQCDDCLKDS